MLNFSTADPLKFFNPVAILQSDQPSTELEGEERSASDRRFALWRAGAAPDRMRLL